METIGEISILEISKKYNLGYEYAENIINRLEEVRYIKKINEHKYAIIHTEQEIDDYIKLHLSELRPIEYIENGKKDNGEYTFISRISMDIEYYKVILPVFIG